MILTGTAQSARIALLGTTALIGFVYSSGAEAQSLRETTVLDPIIVYGEAGQDSPSSRTVLNQEELKDAGVSNVQDLARQTPSVVLTDQGSQRFQINTVRGIGGTIRQDYFNSMLGVYLDGVPLTTAEFNRRFGDIERVEILRGPQGTLFGHNTPAGVINLTSRQASDKAEGELSGTIGNNGQRESSLWVGGPLSKTLTGRLFLDYAHRDGYTNYHSFPGTIDGLESLTGSASLVYKPSDQLSMTLNASLEHVDQGSYAYQPFYSYRDRVLDIAPPNEEVRDSRNLTGIVDYDFGNMQFKSITGYRNYDVQSSNDLAYNPIVAMYGGGRADGDETGNQFSQEFRLLGETDRLRWLIGTMFLTEKVDYDYLFNMPAFGGPSLLSTEYQRHEYAGYGELTWNAIGGLDITAGLRLSHERHDFSNNRGFDGKADYTIATPKFALAYRFDEDRQVYVSATRGARSGGFNRLSSAPAYESEYLWSYETGVKTQWFDNRLTLNAAAFYIDWTDQQVNTIVSPGVVQTTNAGESHSQGIEIEASWRAAEGFDISGYFGVTEGRYDRFVNRDGIDLAGNRLANTPSMTAGLAAQYRWQLDQFPGSAFVRAEYNYIGDHYFDPENRLKQNGYGLVNLRAGLENDRFSATVFVKNLFDQDYRSFGYSDFPGSALSTDVAVAGQPRLIGVTLTTRW